MRPTVDWGIYGSSPSDELESIDRSLALLLRARAKAAVAPVLATAPEMRRRTLQGRRRRRTVRRWAEELAMPEGLAEAICDGVFDRPAHPQERPDDGVVVRLISLHDLSREPGEPEHGRLRLHARVHSR